MTLQSTLQEEIKIGQSFELSLNKLKKEAIEDQSSEFKIPKDDILYYRDRVCVMKNEELTKRILLEPYETSYSVHQVANKMYKYLKESFWWLRMKNDIVKFVARYLTCQKVKAEHQRPAG